MRDCILNPAYVGPRPDVESLVPANARLVLDVGCSNGLVGGAIKSRTGARVFGIELSEEMAAEARNRIDQVYVGDATELLSMDTLFSELFDTIIFADVLEHLWDPWLAVAHATRHLSADGVIITSIPNIRHISTLFDLVVRGYWPYRDRGIHDRTHLRFFTKRNILELLGGAGLQVDVMRANYRIVEAPHSLNRYASMVAKIPGLKEVLTFQYVTRSRRTC